MFFSFSDFSDLQLIVQFLARVALDKEQPVKNRLYIERHTGNKNVYFSIIFSGNSGIFLGGFLVYQMQLL